MRHAYLPGGRVAYHDSGVGDAVILIHGGGPGASGVSNFNRNIAALAAGRRVIAIDLPGYGGSDNRAVEGSLFDALSAVVVALMDALGIAQADLVGNSLGAGTALRTAIDHPSRVRRLVMMGRAAACRCTPSTPRPA